MLLERCSPPQRDLVKLLLWRAWTTHNNITHQSGQTGILDGVQALLSLCSCLDQIDAGYDEGFSNGKAACHPVGHVLKKNKKNMQPGTGTWQQPPEGWSKMNVDGSFVSEDGRAGVGLVARNSVGQVIFTAWRMLSRCVDAAEAEARACVEGIRFSAQWAPGAVIVELYCARVVHSLRRGDDRSDLSFIVAEAKELAQLLVDWRIDLVKRDCNAVANELAHLAGGTPIWQFGWAKHLRVCWT